MQNKKTIKEKWPLLIILTLPFSLMGLSHALYYLDQTGHLGIVDLLGYKTVGHLVQPALHVESLALQEPEGQSSADKLPGTPWVLMIPTRANCESCEATMQASRQLHVALGKEANKLARWEVRVDGSALAPQTGKASVSGLSPRFVSVSPEIFGKLPEHLQASKYWLVDARGWIMMSYPSDVNEKVMMADLKHLFKYAR